jgi:hypothetical protein
MSGYGPEAGSRPTAKTELTSRQCQVWFALKLSKLHKDELNAKFHEVAEILGLTDWLDRKLPGSYSVYSGARSYPGSPGNHSPSDAICLNGFSFPLTKALRCVSATFSMSAG